LASLIRWGRLELFLNRYIRPLQGYPAQCFPSAAQHCLRQLDRSRHTAADVWQSDQPQHTYFAGRATATTAGRSCYTPLSALRSPLPLRRTVPKPTPSLRHKCPARYPTPSSKIITHLCPIPHPHRLCSQIARLWRTLVASDHFVSLCSCLRG
jgi:hypothetical protein